MTYWECPACGYQATTEGEKIEHINASIKDRAHLALVKEKGKYMATDIKEAGKDIVEDVS